MHKSSNYWDDGSEGNYWDDYVGSDSDGDGIGDTPYNIPSGNNKDRYPLMKGTMGEKEGGEEKDEQKGFIPAFELIYLTSALSLALIFKRRKRK